jgi:hypothetical protein
MHEERYARFINTSNGFQPAPERGLVAIDMQQLNTKGK